MSEIVAPIDFQIDTPRFLFRLAQTPEDITHAKKLRYQVFYVEKGAQASEEMAQIQQDFDAYDEHALHVLVEDKHKTYPESIVGTTRLIVSQFIDDRKLHNGNGFYTEQFFDCDKILDHYSRNTTEIGRVCVQQEYRTGKVLSMMWKYTMALIKELDIEVMFGCASFSQSDPELHKNTFAYIHQHYIAEPQYLPQPKVEHVTHLDLLSSDNIDEKAALAEIPPLIKGYLKVGARMSDTAVIDTQFNTVFTCMFLFMKDVSQNATLNRLTK